MSAKKKASKKQTSGTERELAPPPGSGGCVERFNTKLSRFLRPANAECSDAKRSLPRQVGR